MTNTIDKRVVEMDFENDQFERNIGTSLKSIDTLKRGLNLEDAAKSLNGLAAAGQSFSLAGIGEGVSNISNHFSALGIMGITVLSRIADAAIDLGQRLITVVTGIDKIQGGFAEYEAGLSSFQTILANTKTAGATVDDVNAAMKKLNIYANQTIYSFGDMTKAIGLFTAQGVTLDNSVSAIKGIFNIISLTGGDAQKANGAIYQLSQAIASGTVRAQDWISVINAGIGGQDFQNQLMQTARIHGVAVDSMIKKEGSFRLSLQDGWLSSKILLETLQQYTGDLSASQLKSMGYSADQVKEIVDLGNRANTTATQIKSVSQMMETLSSNIVTAWATSFKIVVGDLSESVSLWSEIGGILGNVLQGAADSRNALLQGWKDLGGREAIIKSLRNAFEFLSSVMKPIGEAFSTIFPPITAKILWDLSSGIRRFTADLKIGTGNAYDLKTIFEGVFSVFDIVGKSVIALANGFIRLAKGVNLGPAAKSIFDFATRLATTVTNFRNWCIYNDAFNKTVDKIGGYLAKARDSVISFVKGFAKAFDDFKKKFQEFANTVVSNPTIIAIVNGLKTFVGALVVLFNTVRQINFKSIFAKISADFAAFKKTVAENGLFAAIVQAFKNFGVTIGKLFASFGKISTAGLGDLGTRINVRFGFLANIGTTLSKLFATMGPRIQKAFSIFSKILGTVGDILGKIIDSVLNGLDNINFKDVDFSKFFDTLNAGLLSGLILTVTGFIKNGSGIFDGIKGILGGVKGFETSSKGILDGIKGVLGGVKDSLKAWQEQLKSKVLLTIALSIAILAASLIALSLVDSDKLTKALVSITIMFTDLFGSIALLDNSGGKDGFGSMAKAATGLIAISIAVGLMTLAVIPLANTDPTKLANAMLSITELVAIVVGAASALSTNSGTLLKTSAGILIFSIALNLLVGAVKGLGNIDAQKLTNGLISLGVVLGELVIFMKLTDKLSGKAIINSVGILILAGAMLIMALAVGKFAEMKIDTLQTGLEILGAVLAELALFTNMTKNAANVIETSIGIVILGAAMLIFAEAMKSFAKMSWEEIAKGLVSMAGALTIITVALNFMPKDMILKSIGLVIIAAALEILADVMKKLGGMSWDQVNVGLTTLAVALGIITVAMSAMTEGLPGAAAMLVMAVALLVLIPVLTTLGNMSLAQVGIALLAIAGVFTVLGLAGLILTPVVPIIAALAAILLVFGLACISVGVGMLAFATGMAALAAITTAGVAAITLVITGLIALIPLVATQIATGIIAFAKTVGDGAPIIGAALLSCLRVWLTTIVTFTPEFITSMLGLLTQILTTIANKLPDIIAAGLSIVLSILRGIRDNIYQIVTAAIDIVLNFIAAITDRLPSIIDAGFKLIVAFIKGLGDAIDNNQKEMEAACMKLGTAIINGVVKGIGDAAHLVWEALTGLADGAVKAFKKAIDSRSPSKVFTKIGLTIPQGTANGIDDGASLVNGSIKDLATGAVSTMTGVIGKISDALSMNVDMNPTIRPVIDMTDIVSGGKQIDNLLANKTINVNASANKVSGVSSSMTAKVDTTGINQPANQNGSLQFIQNNYSPVALSRIDIYRQTKTQLTLAKRLVPTS